VTFTAAATGTAPISFAWAFGDGEIGLGAVTTHTYAMSDTYGAVLTATNACGEEIVERGITVVDEERPYRVFLPIVVREMAGTP
jgi:PKD repeat protein